MLSVVIVSVIKLGCYLTEYRCNDCNECLNWNLYWFVLAEKTQATTKSKSTTPDLTTSTTTATENSTPTWINDIFQVLFRSQMSIWSFYLFLLFFSSWMTMALKIKPHQWYENWLQSVLKILGTQAWVRLKFCPLPFHLHIVQFYHLNQKYF